MDNAGYVTLNRQSGLMREMQAVANNIANLSTTGFRKEGVIFAEHVDDLEGAEPSLSMADASGRIINLSQGPLSQTGGALDFAIEGEGFFMIATPDGNQLTRAGSFTASPEGELVTADGHRVLDSGGAPVFVPNDLGPIALARDGTLSAGDTPVARVGVFLPQDGNDLIHSGGTRFRTEGGVVPVEDVTMFQGFLEGSNVNPILEIARMIDVQRAYEMGQGLLDKDDARIRATIETLGR
jgi:flagellar basal-body rod protein FlgF